MSSRPSGRLILGVLVVLLGIIVCVGLAWFNRAGDTDYEWYVRGGDYRGAGPTLSPDGQWIVYSSPRSGNGDLYAVRIDGTGVRRLTDTPACEVEPQFSGDGKRLVYRRQWAGEDSLWLLDFKTRARLPIPNTQGCLEPALSPDGKYVACRRERPRNRSVQDFVLLNVATGRPVTFPFEDCSDAAWDRTGAHLFFVRGGGGEIHRANVDGTADRLLGHGYGPVPSPDGRQIAFLGEPDNQTVWLMNSDGTGVRRLCATRSSKTRLNFTPDGRRLLFRDSTERDQSHLMLLDIRTRRTTNLCSVL